MHRRRVARRRGGLPGVPPARLQFAGFAPEVIAGVDAVTRRAGEVYADFVVRAARDPIGRIVKRADVMDNLDLSRIDEPTKADRSRVKRYRAALEVLG